MKCLASVTVACLMVAPACAPVSAQSLKTARILASQGKVDSAVSAVRASLSANGNDAEAQELLCKLQGSVDRFDEAIVACEAAHKLRPLDSSYTLDLARAYGAKANHSGAFTGMHLVGRVRENFQEAVHLNPRNIDALSDLGEFYVNAPSLVGGGLDKARPVVAQLQPLSPARASRLQGMIADKAGDMEAAQSAFAQELSLGSSPEAYVDMARFDVKRKLWEQAAQHAVLAIQKDNAHGPDTLDAVQILIEIKRDGPIAEKALRGYLAQTHSSSIALFARAHSMLGQVIQQSGDSAGAQEQYRQALALAAGYEPARKALHG